MNFIVFSCVSASKRRIPLNFSILPTDHRWLDGSRNICLKLGQSDSFSLHMHWGSRSSVCGNRGNKFSERRMEQTWRKHRGRKLGGSKRQKWGELLPDDFLVPKYTLECTCWKWVQWVFPVFFQCKQPFIKLDWAHFCSLLPNSPLRRTDLKCTTAALSVFFSHLVKILTR